MYKTGVDWDAPRFGLSTGLHISSFSGLSPNYSDSLVGTIINEDTLGTIYNFPDDLGFKHELKQKLDLYPNPATDQIRILADLNSLRIDSNIGQLVMEINQPNHVIDLSELQSDCII